jgi:hypothetical protein
MVKYALMQKKLQISYHFLEMAYPKKLSRSIIFAAQLAYSHIRKLAHQQISGFYHPAKKNALPS